MFSSEDVLDRDVMRASQSQKKPAINNANGRMSTPFCKFLPQASARRPTISGDHMSPNKWIIKIESAIALARRLTGTVSIISVLMGPVGRKSKNIEIARKLRAAEALEQRNAASDVGTANKTEVQRSQAYPAGFRRCQAVATNPDRKSVV